MVSKFQRQIWEFSITASSRKVFIVITTDNQR